MQRTTFIDFFGITRIVGYSVCVVMVFVAVFFWLAGLVYPLLQVLAMPLLAGWILVGLLIAWVSSLCRFFIARMKFQSMQR